MYRFLGRTLSVVGSPGANFSTTEDVNRDRITLSETNPQSGAGSDSATIAIPIGIGLGLLAYLLTKKGA